MLSSHYLLGQRQRIRMEGGFIMATFKTTSIIFHKPHCSCLPLQRSSCSRRSRRARQRCLFEKRRTQKALFEPDRESNALQRLFSLRNQWSIVFERSWLAGQVLLPDFHSQFLAQHLSAWVLPSWKDSPWWKQTSKEGEIRRPRSIVSIARQQRFVIAEVRWRALRNGTLERVS